MRVSTSKSSSDEPYPAAAPDFNSHATNPSNVKAMLRIDGDLNTMAQRWGPAEKAERRRLVQFCCSQAGNTVTASFQLVISEDQLHNGVCVSCIWWEEQNDYFVTSADIISLLESLVATRFPVDEKNRIRRNLEEFRPATVSKTKPDSEQFFKLIMGLPYPKPRAIEKDVKVFSWRILSMALCKIIGKYASCPHPHA